MYDRMAADSIGPIWQTTSMKQTDLVVRVLNPPNK